MAAPARSEVLRLHESAVSAVVAHAERVTDWDRPACGEWSAADTVRHVLAVADWYHHWLDRAEAGDTSPPFPVDDMAVRNAEEVAARADITPDDGVAQFATRARDYGARVEAKWDLPYAYPFGFVTAGLHLGVAATEWNLHAWDLSGEFGRRHDPADAAALFRAAGACVAAAEGGVRGRLTGLAVPLAARSQPWSTLLRRSGR